MISRHNQVASPAPSPSPAWLGNDIVTRPSHLGSTIASMTRQWHRATTKSPRQCHCQHDSVVTSHHSQCRIGSTVISVTRGLDAYFPNQSSDSEVHYRSGFRARRVPLQPTSWLRYPTTYIINFKSRRVHRHQQDYGTLRWNQLSHIHNSIFFRVNTYVLLYFQLVNILL
jgi:hypothetical protein